MMYEDLLLLITRTKEQYLHLRDLMLARGWKFDDEAGPSFLDDVEKALASQKLFPKSENGGR